MNAADIARQAARRLIETQRYASVVEIVATTGPPYGTVRDALLRDVSLARRMDYARKSGAKQFIYERRTAA